MNSDDFKRIFEQWRPQYLTKEQLCLNTAIEIGEYIDSASLGMLNEGLIDAKSKKYQEFDHWGVRSFGTLLYGKLLIESYCLNNHTPQLEQQLLSSLSTILGELYASIRQEPGDKVGQVLHLITDWVTNYADNDPVRQKLGKAFYAILKITDIGLKNLSPFMEWSIKKYVQDFHTLHGLFDKLLTETEVKLVACSSDEPASSSLSSLLAVQTIGEYFNAKMVEILQDESKEIGKKLTLLEETITVLNSKISCLQQNMAAQAELNAQMQHGQKLLAALESNELKILGRDYFLDLMAKNAMHFQVFMEKLPVSAEKEQLLAKIAQLQHPDTPQKISANLQLAISWAATVIWVAPMYRYAMPAQWQQTIDAIAPATLDSDCKQELQILAKTYLVSLGNKLAQLAQEEKILTDDLQLPPIISKNLFVEWEAFLQESQSVVAAVAVYRRVFDSIVATSRRLKIIARLDASSSEFISKYDGFLVRLSNLLAKVASIFKTEKAKMLDDVRFFKAELVNIQQESSDFVIRELREFNENPAIPSAIKESLSQQFAVEVREQERNNLLIRGRKNRIRRYELLSQGFFEVVPAEKNLHLHQRLGELEKNNEPIANATIT